ncbi:hypothetical protein FF011L_12180 [Roseimaritima multifibrata]|uniref:Uncharacterized protein n=1 Tax=Roseimaritima multifibrata TaxID=1930274 RepID=A0A517MC81_9BACT|nr:hypothetical protein [Roseimaritima multifibrata]QDS92475.1 hypothetical protein FF011L_12180 [Roseimaritima multifibrata]
MILTDDRDIEIDFTDAIDGFVFDQMKPELPKFHGLGAMRRVDLIVEMPEFVTYVEIKDPSHPNARPEGIQQIIEKYEDGSLAQSFANKLIDSFVYGWAEQKALKPIRYYSLFTIDSELAFEFGDKIAALLPPLGCPTNRWKRAFIEDCQVYDLELWNANFPNWPARRISETSSQST